ncbi:hypothetical protein [Bacillus sp. JCM 19041]|uniref:hypothetical protein n=1 Tax=Bacillus sp. JCM 19041 TaxID=1460637 RepID=UPI0012E0FA34
MISEFAIDQARGLEHGEPIHIVVNHMGYNHCFTFQVQEDEDCSRKVIQYV